MSEETERHLAAHQFSLLIPNASLSSYCR